MTWKTRSIFDIDIPACVIATTGESSVQYTKHIGCFTSCRKHTEFLRNTMP